MKKIFILCLLIILISGCSVKYELKIDQDYSHYETISVDGVKDELGLLTTDKWIDFYIKDNPDYTKKENTVNATNYHVSVESVQGDNKVYSSSKAANRLFDLTITNYNNERTYYYKFNQKYDQDLFNDNYYEKLEFILDSDIPLSYSNADKFEKGKYYWIFNKELMDITFSYKMEEIEEKNTVESFLEKNNIKSLHIEIVVGIIVLAFVVMIIIKNKKHNKI